VRNRLPSIAVTVTCLGILAARPATAYVDPAAGSMMLQLALAGLAGVAVAVKMLWGRILALFGVRRPAEPGEEAPPETQSGV
jgi:hypothetical protein